MFINVIETTDDLIHYGSNCSPVPLHLPEPRPWGETHGLSWAPWSQGCFLTPGLHPAYSFVQRCADVARNLNKIYVTIALFAAGLLTPATHDAGACITGFALCNSLCEAEFFLATTLAPPFTLVELPLEISLAPKTVSIWPTTCNA